MSWLFGYSSAPEPVEPAAPAPPKPSASRERTDEGPTFASSKCPRGPGLENSCELPFGLVWTPMAELEKENGGEEEGRRVIQCPTSSLPPVLCLTCLAYLNPHCKVKITTGAWTCALCGAENIMPKRLVNGPTALLNPALTLPMVEYRQPLPMPPNEEDVCTIVLVVDANLDRNDALGVLHAVEKVLPDLEENSKIKVGLIVFDQAVAMYQLGIAGVASADVYTMEIEDEDQEQARQTAMEERAYLQTITCKDDLESLSQCLSAVFGVTVDNPKKAESRMQVLKKQKEARMRQEQLETPTFEIPTESPWIQKRNKAQQRCTGEALQCAMDLASLQECRTSRILLFTNGSANMGDGSVVAEVESTAKNDKRKSKAVGVSQMSEAIQYYDTMATIAMEAGIAIDVFCAGFLELGLPAYQALVGPSGGYVLPHSTFDSPHLVHNLGFCLKYTYVSRTEAEIPAGQTKEEKPNSRLTRFFGRKPTTESAPTSDMSHCVVDLRTDSFMSATHLVGPGELVDSSSSKSGASRLLSNEKAAFAAGLKLATAKDLTNNNVPSVEALDLSLTRIRLPRYDPLASISFMVQINDSFVAEEDLHSFFQATVRFISRDGKNMITRVCTRRLPVADSVSDYVKNLDDQVVSVLLAKGAVYRSIHGREETEETKDKVVAGDPETLEKLAYDAQLDLDATIQRISGAFRLLGLEEKTRSIDLERGRDEKKESSSPSSLDFAFPPQLSEALRRLYHLRRGALVSPGPMGSMDDRAGARELFLRFPLEDCLGMMAPRLWSTGNLENAKTFAQMSAMVPFPAETMALWDASIIAADQHDVQFVWSGKACTQSDAFDAIREKYKKYLVSKAKDRFPLPEIHMLFDGDSMSRRFTTRLAPSHADSPDQQIANFPELSTLSSASMESLRSRFRFYDAASDASFRNWFWSVSSATHASREDGMSLCE